MERKFTHDDSNSWYWLLEVQDPSNRPPRGAETGVEAVVEKVEDIETILEYDILMTPGLASTEGQGGGAVPNSTRSKVHPERERRLRWTGTPGADHVRLHGQVSGFLPDGHLGLHQPGPRGAARGVRFHPSPALRGGRRPLPGRHAQVQAEDGRGRLCPDMQRKLFRDAFAAAGMDIATDLTPIDIRDMTTDEAIAKVAAAFQGRRGVAMAETTFMGVPAGPDPLVPTIDYDRCSYCMECDMFCPHQVFEHRTVSGDLVVAHPNHCVVFCRACAKACGPDAFLSRQARDHRPDQAAPPASGGGPMKIAIFPATVSTRPTGSHPRGCARLADEAGNELICPVLWNNSPDRYAKSLNELPLLVIDGCATRCASKLAIRLERNIDYRILIIDDIKRPGVVGHR